jgi:hypothetical protein
LPRRADETIDAGSKRDHAELIEISLWLDGAAYQCAEGFLTADRENEVTLSLCLQVPDEDFTAEAKDLLKESEGFSGVIAAFSSLDDV